MQQIAHFVIYAACRVVATASQLTCIKMGVGVLVVGVN